MTGTIPASAVTWAAAILARLVIAVVVTFALAAMARTSAAAAGGPGNVLLIIDPTDPVSMELGHEYQLRRQIPPTNVLYMAPGAVNYSAFAGYQAQAVIGEITSRGQADQIDFVVIAPTADFFVDARDLVTATCSPVRRFSLSTAYSLAFETEAILAGGRNYSDRNGYYNGSGDFHAFDSQVGWSNGSPISSEDGPRYLIGHQLGVLGPRGNTPYEIQTMFRRSVTADNSEPDGTVYLMSTADNARNVRARFYADVAPLLRGLGMSVETLDGNLPAGRHDVLGIITGAANPPIAEADMKLLPGAFADHLTSFAATFDNGSQTKMSEWIRAGASGTAGTVEEPCNYPRKFPHPSLFASYARGSTLGEALFRSLAYVPYQTMALGDPLTRPFSSPPSVNVSREGGLTGVVTLDVDVELDAEETPVSTYVSVDGVVRGSVPDDGRLQMDTTTLTDGWHQLRVVAIEDDRVQEQGEWVGSIRVRNRGRFVNIEGHRLFVNGALTVAFDVTHDDQVDYLTVEQNGRVLKRTRSGPNVSLVWWQRGIPEGLLYLVGHYADGSEVRSAGYLVRQTADTGGSGYNYGIDQTRHVLPGAPALLDLPFVNVDAPVSVIQPPEAATVTVQADSAFVLPEADAAGTDTLILGLGPDKSITSTVTLNYCAEVEVTSGLSDAAVCPGEPVKLNVDAEPGTVYTWFADGELLPGVPGGQAEIPALAPGATVEIEVDVARQCGRVLNPTRLTAVITARPANHPDCLTAVYLPRLGNEGGE